MVFGRRNQVAYSENRASKFRIRRYSLGSPVSPKSESVDQQDAHEDCGEANQCCDDGWGCEKVHDVPQVVLCEA